MDAFGKLIRDMMPVVLVAGGVTAIVFSCVSVVGVVVGYNMIVLGILFWALSGR